MTKSILVLSAIAAVALATPSFAEDTDSASSNTQVKSDSNGNYTKETTAEHNDAAGTTTKQKTETKVRTDKDGNVTKTTTSDSSTDPKGLMNKTTSGSTTTVEKNADGSASYYHKEKVNGKTVEEEKTQNN